MRAFYAEYTQYADFESTNWKPEFWLPVKHAVEVCLRRNGACRILEFGAGRTRFGSYLGDLRPRVVFDVQDITDRNREHLETQADHLHFCELTRITESYDIVFSTFVWEHLPAPQAALQHLLALLADRGRLFIASPRYDFPLYLSPSARHLSWADQARLRFWLIADRLRLMCGGLPSFAVHLRPRALVAEWVRDADAVHWVSLWDLKRSVPPSFSVRQVRLPAHGLVGRFWARWLLLFVEIARGDREVIPSHESDK
jgi:SAM-dependent methyltransferase